MPHPVSAAPSFQKEDCRYLQEYLYTFNNEIPLFCASLLGLLRSVSERGEDAMVTAIHRPQPRAPKQAFFSATVTPDVTSSEEDMPTLASMTSHSDLMDADEEKESDVCNASDYSVTSWSDDVCDSEVDLETGITFSNSMSAEIDDTFKCSNVSQKIIQLGKLLAFAPIEDATSCGPCTDVAKNCSDATAVSRDSPCSCSHCDIKAIAGDSAVVALLNCACAMISIFQYKDASIIKQYVESAKECVSRAAKASSTDGLSPFLCRAYAALELIRLINPIRSTDDELHYVHTCERYVDRLTWAQKQAEKEYTLFLLSLVQCWQEISIPDGQPFQSPMLPHTFQHTSGNIKQLLERSNVQPSENEMTPSTLHRPDKSATVATVPSRLNILNKPPALSIKPIELCPIKGFREHALQDLTSLPSLPVSYVIENDVDGVEATQEQNLKQERPQLTKFTYEQDTGKVLTEEEEQKSLLIGAFELRNKLGPEMFIHYANHKLLYWHRRLNAAESVCVSPRSPHFQSGACFLNAIEFVQSNTVSGSSAVISATPSADESGQDQVPVHICSNKCDYNDFKNDFALAQMLFEYDRSEQENMYGGTVDLMTTTCTHPYAYMFLRFSACMHSFYGAMMAEEEHVDAASDLNVTRRKSLIERMREVEKGLFALSHFLAKHPDLICTPQSVYVSITVDQMLENVFLLTADTLSTPTDISSHHLRSLQSARVLEPMRKIARMRHAYLPYNVHLKSQLCSVQDLAGQMLEVRVSDPMAIVPPCAFSGSVDRVYSNTDYLHELSIIDQYKAHVGPGRDSDITRHFPWDCITENMHVEVNILSGVTRTAAHGFKSSKNIIKTCIPYKPGVTDLLTILVKRKPGRPRKYPRPEVFPMVIPMPTAESELSVSTTVYPWCT